MNPRAPDAEEISVVLLGSLNPGIFHPEWFRRQEILSSQESDEAKIKLVSPEVTEVLFLDMKLDVFPDRLVLETTDSSRAEKLQDVILNILTRLPHTPITACGLNDVIQFDLEDEEYWHRVGHTLAPKELIWNELLEKPGMALRYIHGLLVGSNFHYPVPRNESGTPQSGRVVDYVQEMWKPALEKARGVAYQIFEKIKK